MYQTKVTFNGDTVYRGEGNIAELPALFANNNAGRQFTLFQQMEHNPVISPLPATIRLVAGVVEVSLGTAMVTFAPLQGTQMILNGCKDMCRGTVGMIPCFGAMLLHAYDSTRA